MIIRALGYTAVYHGEPVVKQLFRYQASFWIQYGRTVHRAYIRLFSSPAGDGLGKVVYVRHIGFVKVGIIYRTEIWISRNATSVKYIIRAIPF